MKKHRSAVAALVILIIIFANAFFTKTASAPVAEISPTLSPISSPPSPAPHTDFREISKINTSEKIAVITVDAGFGEKSAPGLLAALKKHHIKATFFLVGNWIEEHQDLTKQIARDGHEIFNHSYSHPDFTTLTSDTIKSELQKMDDVLFKTVGLHTKPYYRAPSGARNNAVNQAAAEAGYQHIYWSVDPQDWRLDVSGETIKTRVVNNIHPGAIVLLHIADSTTGDVADDLFTALEQKGYKLISLTEGLAL
jgi:peptidoglycan/xylan/chitin deacetylase (PgdA/CDA1 family)